MTPAIRAAQRAGLVFEIRDYQHDPRVDSYGLEVAQLLGVPAEHVFKTLIVKLNTQELLVALVPVHQSVDLKALAVAAGAKRAEMADSTEAERATGYVVGGISPLGQRKRLRVVIDESILALKHVFVSAGRRGLEIVLRPEDLIRVCQAQTAAIARGSQ